jgi:potassium-transporting ATPase ATP-binding subunit
MNLFMKDESSGVWRWALYSSFVKLDPREQVKNPVMFVVFAGSISVSVFATADRSLFSIVIAIWLWFTVLFANFAEAMAEGRGKAHATALRRSRVKLVARKLRSIEDTEPVEIPAENLQAGDIVVCRAGDMIPSDGEVIDGIATVDESAITGESAPVVRESGGDRSAVTGGTRVISDRIVVRITATRGNTFLDRMISLIENAKRQKTPNEIALGMVLTAMTLLFIVVVLTLLFFGKYTAIASHMPDALNLSLPVLVSLLVCLIPTTIGGLLSAIGIGGISRLLKKNVLALSGRAVEAAGDIDVLLLDKTGTITLGNRMAVAFIPAPGISEQELADAAQASSLPDETPEGRSIVVLAKRKFGMRGLDGIPPRAKFIPFSAATRMSGLYYYDAGGTIAQTVRKGAVEAIRSHIEKLNGTVPATVRQAADEISRSGGTPILVARDNRALGIVHLKDVVKGGIRKRFARLRKMGIRTVMITGDNPLTAAAIAAEAGVDDFVAEATPESKLAKINEERAAGHRVAMIGDGTNDAPALAQADVGVAMQSGTQAAREAGNMVDLDSNPTKLIDIVETGKQILMTRGSLTTFSFANDIAKYFAILPAMFGAAYAANGAPGPLLAFDVMHLHSPQSAILSAVIFNALIIVLLIPLALRGVAYRPGGAAAVLRRNMLVYGLGGIVAPFIGIKVIDLLLTLSNLPL